MNSSSLEPVTPPAKEARHDGEELLNSIESVLGCVSMDAHARRACAVWALLPAYLPSQIINGCFNGVVKTIEAMWPTARRLLFSDSIAAPAGWSKPSLTRSKQ